MQLELNLFQPVGDVLAVDSFDEDGPLMCMIGVDTGRSVIGIKRLGNAAVD